jgi:hypothetical protein
MNSHIPAYCYLSIHFIIILYVYVSFQVLWQGVQAFLSPPIRATCYAHVKVGLLILRVGIHL